MPTTFICFDTESAQGRYKGLYTEELIEISMMDVSHHELFCHRFKPKHLKRWDTKIHHITPAMLADEPSFDIHKERIRDLFNSANYIVGFSLVDDFKAMARAGIEGLEKKPHIELRHLYWYCIGRDNGVPYYSGPGLTACAREMGVEIIEQDIHSAHGDTKVTLDLFLALMHRFASMEHYSGDMPTPGSKDFDNLLQLMFKRLAEAKLQYDSSVAAGYMLIAKDPEAGEGQYKFVPSVTQSRDGLDVVLSIPVKARKRAAFELEKQFASRRVDNTKFFTLTPDDFDTIKGYTNEFDNQEAMYQKLVGVLRSSTKVLRKKEKLRLTQSKK